MMFAERATIFRAARALVVSILLVLLHGLFAAVAHAALTIEIIGTGAKQIPIAIVPFRAESGLSQQVTPVVAADLTNSGLFKMIDAGGVNPPPYDPQDVNYGTWRARGADAVVIGTVAPRPDGRYEVQFRLMGVTKQAQLAGFSYVASAAQLRLTAHKIADIVYEKLTGDPGVFATRILYVV